MSQFELKKALLLLNEYHYYFILGKCDLAIIDDTDFLNNCKESIILAPLAGLKIINDIIIDNHQLRELDQISNRSSYFELVKNIEYQIKNNYYNSSITKPRNDYSVVLKSSLELLRWRYYCNIYYRGNYLGKTDLTSCRENALSDAENLINLDRQHP